MAMVLFAIMRFVFSVPIAGSVVALMFSTLVYVFALLSLGLLVATGRKSDAGAPNVDDVHVAERFFFRIHFSARNNAVDFLCARRALAHDIFHRFDARDHFARRQFPRILAESAGSHSDVELAFHSLRAAVPKKDRVTGARYPVWGARASRVLASPSCSMPANIPRPRDSDEPKIVAAEHRNRHRDACAPRKPRE